MTWEAVPNATGVPRLRARGWRKACWTVSTTAFTDTGATGTAEAVPTSPAPWSVKNLFELKNARNVVIEANIFENHWKESQPGYAIVFTRATPTAAVPGAWWSTFASSQPGAERLRRHQSPRLRQRQPVAADRRHHDPPEPLHWAVDLARRNGWFILIGDEPRDVVSSTTPSTPTAHRAQRVRRHGDGPSRDSRLPNGRQRRATPAYGINGSFFSLRQRHPQRVLPRRGLHRELSRRRFGVTVSGRQSVCRVFDDRCANIVVADYTVREGSLLKRAAPDGGDIGVDYPALEARVATVGAGINPWPSC